MKGECYLPKQHKTELDALALFDETISRLPLDSCHTERNILTGRLEFVAPENMEFKMSGEFIVCWEGIDGMHLMSPPHESLAIVERRKSEEPHYQDPRDEDDLVLNYEPLVSFSGQRLGLSINDQFYGNKFYLPTLWLNDPSVNVHVAGPVRVTCGPGLREYSWEQTNGSGIYELDFFEMPQAGIMWEFGDACGQLPEAEILLEPSVTEEPEIIVIENEEIDEKIWTPHSSATRDQYVDFYRRAGIELSPEQLLDLMRQRRLAGWPLADDPLRYFRIVQNREGHSIDVQSLAERIENARGQRPSYQEARSYEKQQSRQHYRQVRAEKLRGMLTVVTDSGPLSKVVGEHARVDWLDNELGEEIEF